MARAKKPVTDTSGADDPTQAGAVQTEAQAEPAEDAVAGDGESAGSDAPAANGEPPGDDAGDDSGDDGATPAPDAATVPPATDRPRRAAAALTLVAAGALVAVAGYVAAHYMLRGWPIFTAPDQAELAATIRNLDDRLAALETRPDDGAALQQALAVLEARLADLETTIAATDTGQTGTPSAALQTQTTELAATVGGLDDRLAALEARPEDGAALQQALATLEARLAGIEKRLAAMETAAETTDAGQTATATAALRRAAILRITSALDSGTGFADALNDLEHSGVTDIPQVLTAMAPGGVATTTALLDGFPDAARAAIAAETEQAVAAGTMTRLGGFFRRQIGVRSLEPRDGDDADAVLSRAEAAVRAGNLAAGLEELHALSPAAAVAMGGWIARAETRQAAVEAALRLKADLKAGMDDK